MYEEYIKQWKHYKSLYGLNTCFVMMVGMFYELYDILDPLTQEGQTNVKQAVETLGITLTTKKKDGPKGEDCYFAGFPESSLQKFAGILTREGWTLVVADQKKNAKGDVISRPVTRIFSPGTHMEAAGVEAPYLASIWLEEESGAYAAAAIDLTTGTIKSYESIDGQADTLIHFFQVHPPKETIIYWRGAPFTMPQENQVRRRYGLLKGTLHFELANKEEQGGFEKETVRKDYLQRIFSSQASLLPLYEQLHLTKKPLTERVLICLLRFAEDHIPSAIQMLQNHSIWSSDEAVYLGNNTLLQLNYISVAKEQSVVTLFQKCLTSLGRRGMYDRLLYPYSDPVKIQKRLDEVETAYQVPQEQQKQIDATLRLIHDISRLHRKIMLYTVTAEDILALDQSYGSIQQLQNLQTGNLAMTHDCLDSFMKFRSLFLESFDIEKAKQAVNNEDLCFLPSFKAPKIAEIEVKLAEIRQEALNAMNRISKWASLPEDSLRLESQDTLSYYFSATSKTLTTIKEISSRTPFPFSDLVLQPKKSGRGSIRFSLLETLHGKILSLRSSLKKAIEEELPQVCSSIPIQQTLGFEEWLRNIDVTFALAKVAKENRYVKPILIHSTESSLKATGLRHPLIESLQNRIEYVKHDVSLGSDDENGWLLYGMNASGKSSLMKSIGISVLLAQAGSYVPATTFELCPFKAILTRILNQDNLWAGLSSFAVEVSELRDIFERASPQSLVLGDELCSGTESVSATSLVAAGITYLHRKNARFIFATHLHGLYSLPAILQLPKLALWHLRVSYDPAADKLIYDRSLHKGPGGTLYGLEVARAMHLSHEILKEAHAFRKQLLGETTEEAASPSSWNASLIRKDCEVCGTSIVNGLEVHHISPRKKGIDNSLRNLVVVCQKCHDDHHSGITEIGPLQQTSEGPKRLIKVKVKAKVQSDEQHQIIESYLRKYPNLPIQRILYDLKHQEDIQISESALRKLRNSIT
jgi:DNA mismatch repair protein MutS